MYNIIILYLVSFIRICAINGLFTFDTCLHGRALINACLASFLSCHKVSSCPSCRSFCFLLLPRIINILWREFSFVHSPVSNINILFRQIVHRFFYIFQVFHLCIYLSLVRLFPSIFLNLSRSGPRLIDQSLM